MRTFSRHFRSSIRGCYWQLSLLLDQLLYDLQSDMTSNILIGCLRAGVMRTFHPPILHILQWQLCVALRFLYKSIQCFVHKVIFILMSFSAPFSVTTSFVSAPNNPKHINQRQTADLRYICLHVWIIPSHLTNPIPSLKSKNVLKNLNYHILLFWRYFMPQKFKLNDWCLKQYLSRYCNSFLQHKIVFRIKSDQKISHFYKRNNVGPIWQQNQAKQIHGKVSLQPL